MVRRCLESLSTCDPGAGLIVVVDNSAGSTAHADRYGPGVSEVLRTPNDGYGAAVNAGTRRALARRPDAYVAVLNDDVEVDAAWLAPLIDALDADPGIGAVQPVLVDDDGRIGGVGVELDRFAAGSDIATGRPLDELGDARDIDIFTGGAVLMRPEFLRETGGFDERYFLYYEDVDLALRGAELGWRYRCETDAIVRHRGGATTDALGVERLRLQERNRLWVAARFASPATLSRAVWLSIRRLRHQPRRAHAHALASGIAGMPSALVRRARQSVSSTD